MILIADSGATKTDWACVSRENGTQIRFQSQGYNPNYITGPEIAKDILMHLPDGFPRRDIDEIYFYGAGVSELMREFMTKVLLEVFPTAKKVFVVMDTLGSCRALLLDKPGFAAIIGTGMNTCFYDGENEGLNIESGGFILGDEGSGANLGKRLILDYLRHTMPDNVYEETKKAIGMTNDEIIAAIYQKPFPNRFCAQFAKFIQDHYDFDPYFKNLTTEAFRDMFRNVVSKYPDYQKYSFNAVGSVAFHHKFLLEPVVKEFGMKMGRILKAPMDGLIEYHLEITK